jgi:mono/diheme cytochrome c family protein
MSRRISLAGLDRNNMKSNGAFRLGILALLAGIRVFAAPNASSSALLSTNLVWDSLTKSTNLLAGGNESHFLFNFTNVSHHAIGILSVRTSCGCTTAQLPPLPWTIAPGTNGSIAVTVAFTAESGTLLKTVTVDTDRGSELLTASTTIIPPPTESVSQADREKDLAVAQTDRQAVFGGDCARCHSIQGNHKYGKELYDADCAICHEGPRRAAIVSNLHSIPQKTDTEFWRMWISYGRPHSLMPAFAATEGGPLTDVQIITLAAYLNTAIPSRQTALEPHKQAEAVK